MDRREAPVNATADVEAKIEQQGELPPGMRGTDAAAAVLCVLAQRLSRGEARDLRRVAAHLDVSAPKAEEITRAVFTAVRQTLPVKEQQDVAGQLPWDLEQLWRST